MTDTNSQQPLVVLLGAGMGGRGVATALASSAHIMVVDRDVDFASKAADLVTAAGGSAEATAVDLTDLAAVTDFRDQLLAQHGRVDAVVHLVGGWAGTDTMTPESIDQWNSLLPGVMTTVQTTSVAFRDCLMSAPHGRYCMVTSTSARNPKGGTAAYTSLKAAAETWVAALGDSFAGSPARSCILAVLALVDDGMRAAKPDQDYSNYTDTKDLGAAVREILTDEELANGAYLDLTRG